MLNDPIENAAVALAGPLLLAFNAVNNLFGVGSSSLMSRSLGKKDYETVGKASAFGFYGALFFGLVFSILCTVFRGPLLQLLGADSTTINATNGYINWTVSLGAAPAILNVVMAYLVRSEGAAMHASIGTMSGCFLNIILDPIMIFGIGPCPRMGIEGAALATGLGQVVSLVIYLGVYFSGTLPLQIGKKHLVKEKGLITRLYSIGIPASLNIALPSLLIASLNVILASFSQIYVTILGIYYKLQTFLYLPANGIIQGIRPLVGYNYGAKEYRRVNKIYLTTLAIDSCIMILGTIICLLIPGQLIGLFTENPQTIQAGSLALRIISAGFSFGGNGVVDVAAHVLLAGDLGIHWLYGRWV